MAMFGLFTKQNLIDVASAVAEANGTTLGNTVKTINDGVTKLEYDSAASNKEAAQVDDAANKTFQAVVSQAEKDRQVEAAKAARLRAEAAAMAQKAASKKKAISLLS